MHSFFLVLIAKAVYMLTRAGMEQVTGIMTFLTLLQPKTDLIIST